MDVMESLEIWWELNTPKEERDGWMDGWMDGVGRSKVHDPSGLCPPRPLSSSSVLTHPLSCRCRLQHREIEYSHGGPPPSLLPTTLPVCFC